VINYVELKIHGSEAMCTPNLNLNYEGNSPLDSTVQVNWTIKEQFVRVKARFKCFRAGVSGKLL
jgi:hypothetical protein